MSQLTVAVPSSPEEQREPFVRPCIPAMFRSGARSTPVGLALIVLVLSGPVSLTANSDGAGEEPTTAERVQAQPDFLFSRPGLSLGVRGQWNQGRTDSKFFKFAAEGLTLESGDFNAPGVIVDLGFALGSRVTALVGLDFTSTLAHSEYRDFTDAEDLPIEQDTRFRQFDLFGSVALALLPRGRAIGQLSWVPSAVIPYVGAGGGLLRYEFVQAGDFVDFRDMSIQAMHFESARWTPSAHVFAGGDVKIARQIFLTAEGRYIWADAEVSDDFVFDGSIDLTGVRITAGVRLVF